jgi:YVTN family beta-propeller protein
VGIAFSRDGKTAYVALNGRNSVLVVDAVNRKTEREIAVGLAPFSVVLSKDESRLFVSNRGGGNSSELAPAGVPEAQRRGRQRRCIGP